MSPQASSYPVVIRPVEAADARLFHELATASTLHSLQDAAQRQEVLVRGIVLGAFGEDQILGCCCLRLDEDRSYLGLNGSVRALPRSNAYLCSTFVRPEHRRSGLGMSLYAERLKLAQSLGKSALAVEILGRGVPLSLDPVAHVGYRFHTSAGFIVAGSSLEEDHGPMLVFR